MMVPSNKFYVSSKQFPFLTDLLKMGFESVCPVVVIYHSGNRVYLEDLRELFKNMMLRCVGLEAVRWVLFSLVLLNVENGGK